MFSNLNTRASRGARIAAGIAVAAAFAAAPMAAQAAATHLVFTTQPSGAVAGSAFTGQPVVTAKDSGGLTDTEYTGTVTLTITSGTGPGALSACPATQASAGVITFSGCKIDTAGTGYKLTATDDTAGTPFTVDSASFYVTGFYTGGGVGDAPFSGTVNPGPLSVSVPAISNFSTTLSGATLTVTPAVAVSSVTDATGVYAGYDVGLSATDLIKADAGAYGMSRALATGMSWTSTTPSKDANNHETDVSDTGPTAGSVQAGLSTSKTIASAAAGMGQDQWNLPAGTPLSVTIPSDAQAGSYSSTLTFTVAPKAYNP